MAKNPPKSRLSRFQSSGAAGKAGWSRALVPQPLAAAAPRSCPGGHRGGGSQGCPREETARGGAGRRGTGPDPSLPPPESISNPPAWLRAPNPIPVPPVPVPRPHHAPAPMPSQGHAERGSATEVSARLGSPSNRDFGGGADPTGSPQPQNHIRGGTRWMGPHRSQPREELSTSQGIPTSTARGNTHAEFN